MTLRTFVLTTLVAGFTVPAFAQTTPAAAPRAKATTQTQTLALPPPPPPAPPVAGGPLAAPRRPAQAVNLKIEFTLTDQRGSGSPVKRTVSVVVADQHTGQIRSSSDLAGIAVGRVLNVDTTPELLADGKIRVGLSLQYSWLAQFDGNDHPAHGAALKTSTNDSMSLILESGKPVIVAQSADPIEDRQITVEVKATMLK